MNRYKSVGLKLTALVFLILLLADPAISERPHYLEARLTPNAWIPQGAALMVSYNQGAEIRLGHDWQAIALLSGFNAQTDHGLLHYRLIIEQLDQVHASVATVSVQYRLVADE